MDVKHNFGHCFIMFTPDADIVVVNVEEKRIIGIEVKGYRTFKGKMKRANVYEAIGEALMYLVNPYFEIDGRWLQGCIFDEVWLCYPFKKDFEDIIKVVSLTPIRLLSAYEGLVRAPKPNPFVNKKFKEILLKI